MRGAAALPGRLGAIAAVFLAPLWFVRCNRGLRLFAASSLPLLHASRPWPYFGTQQSVRVSLYRT